MAQLRRRNPKISHREAGRKWAEAHPSPDGTQAESVARRLADKLRDREGVRKQLVTERRLLLAVFDRLLTSTGYVGALLVMKGFSLEDLPPGGRDPMDDGRETVNGEESDS
jgi:hypothetical protein